MITPCDLLVRDATLVMPETPAGWLADGAIAVHGGRIVAIGSCEAVLAKWRGLRTLEAQGALVHAGLVEPHFHIGQYISRGLHRKFADAQRPDLTYAAWKAAITPAEEHVGVALAALHCLKAGITCVVDPGTLFDTEGAAAALRAVGLRGVLAAPYIWDEGAPLPGLVSGALHLRVPADLVRCRALLDGSVAGTGDRVASHIAIYGEHTASDTLWQEAAAVALDKGLTLSAHVMFDPRLSAAFKADRGHSVVAHLDGLGVLGPNVTLTHLNALDDRDIDILLERCTRAIWCPANARLAEAHGGVNRLTEFAQRGGVVGVGMDMPHDHAIGEIGTVARLISGAEGPTSRALFGMMTREAARTIDDGTIGGDVLGVLEVGAAADIVVRWPNGPERMPSLDFFAELTTLARPGGVRTVLVGGEVMLAEGVPTRVDAVRLSRRGREASQALFRRIGYGTVGPAAAA
ncbi:MAG: amidohydrolase family protein [Devosia sp.]